MKSENIGTPSIHHSIYLAAEVILMLPQQWSFIRFKMNNYWDVTRQPNCELSMQPDSLLLLTSKNCNFSFKHLICDKCAP